MKGPPEQASDGRHLHGALIERQLNEVLKMAGELEECTSELRAHLNGTSPNRQVENLPEIATQSGMLERWEGKLSTIATRMENAINASSDLLREFPLDEETEIGLPPHISRGAGCQGAGGNRWSAQFRGP